MTDDEQKKIFAKNLRYFLTLNGKSQKEVADAINVSTQTFNTWCQGIALPRMGKVEILAKYFKILKSDLIDDKNVSVSSKYDLRVAQLLNEVKNNPSLRDFIITYMQLTTVQQEIVVNLVNSLSNQ